MASAWGSPLTFRASLSHSIVEKLVHARLETQGEHAHHGDLGDHGRGLEALERLGTALAGTSAIRPCGTGRARAAR